MKNSLFRLSVFLFISTLPAKAAGGEGSYKFNPIRAEAGLSNNEVKCIYKDKTGFVWLGTPSGLNRYDGYDIVPCKQDLSGEPAHSSNTDIQWIQEDAQGRLWLKTRQGYAAYDTSLERFAGNTDELLDEYSGTDGFNKSPENLLYIDPGKNFWFVTWEDVRMYDPESGRLAIFGQGGPGELSRGLIRDVKQGRNRYWFLYENGVLECMEAQTRQVISRDSAIHKAARLKNNREIRLFADSSGDVWVYGIGAHYGLAHYEAARDKWTRYSLSADPPFRLSNNVVTSVEEDDKGRIWAGTDHGGVIIIDKATGVIACLRHDEDDPHSIPQNTIKSLYRDDSGIIWLGTYKNGACYYHESIYKFDILTGKTKIPFPDVNCFHESEDKNLWIGTNGGGLFHYDRRNGNTPATNIFPATRIHPPAT